MKKVIMCLILGSIFCSGCSNLYAKDVDDIPVIKTDKKVERDPDIIGD